MLLLRDYRKKKPFKFILLLFLAYYEKLKQNKKGKKIRDEKVGRPIIQQSNICGKGENHNLTA